MSPNSPALVATCDLCDLHKGDTSGNFRVLPPVFRSYGGLQKFSGSVVTVKCFEDNSPVKAAVESPGEASYSPEALDRCALLASELRRLRTHVGDPLLDVVRRIIDTTGVDVELAQPVGDGTQAQLCRRLPLRTTEVRHEHHGRILAHQVLDRRNRRGDARVIRDLPVVHRHVEVDAHEHALAGNLLAGNRGQFAQLGVGRHQATPARAPTIIPTRSATRLE